MISVVQYYYDMRQTHFIIAAMLCACSLVLTMGQDQEMLKVLSVVNENSRPRLAKRLEDFMAYNRSKEWEKLFKLLDKQNAENKTPESFVKEMNEFGRQDFVPERTEAEEPIGQEYRIYGCLTRADVGSVKGGVVAYLQGGDWYFTPYFVSYGSGTSPMPCKAAVNSDEAQ
ncbi:MAG: hypothetical protein LC794_03140 [Acidobacteria bacterium]|nr:hypothetical protein [Acidobacteriota bacterium]